MRFRDRMSESRSLPSTVVIGMEKYYGRPQTITSLRGGEKTPARNVKGVMEV